MIDELSLHLASTFVMGFGKSAYKDQKRKIERAKKLKQIRETRMIRRAYREAIQMRNEFFDLEYQQWLDKYKLGKRLSNSNQPWYAQEN